MCCSEHHYPKNAGIFRTDQTGFHKHYADVVTLPGPNDELGRPTEVEMDPAANYPCYGAEDDHWHAILPVRLTVCVDNQGANTFGLRSHDWARWSREASMGMARGHVYYANGMWMSGNQGNGYDFKARFRLLADNNPALQTPLEIVTERDRIREKVLIAVAEGMDMSEPAFNALLVEEISAGLRIQYIATRAVTRGETPDLATWTRSNPFVKPPIDGNEMLYGSDMGGYIMGDAGAGSWSSRSWANIEDLNEAMLYQPPPPPEKGIQKAALGAHSRVVVPQAPKHEPNYPPKPWRTFVPPEQRRFGL